MTPVEDHDIAATAAGFAAGMPPQLRGAALELIVGRLVALARSPQHLAVLRCGRPVAIPVTVAANGSQAVGTITVTRADFWPQQFGHEG